MYSNDFHRRAASMIFALVVTMLLAAAPAFAAEPAGRVLTTKGTVTATDRDDFERPLSRNDVVYPGETLRTGESGRVQVRFRDDALVDLKPDTEFKIERYQEASEESGGSAVMNLLKGALRTITGAIGNNEGDEYAVDTPVATIGIRGTDYSLEFCDANCAGNGRAPGLYGRVDDGSIITETGAGTGTFNTGNYFFVPKGGAPQRIIAPPEGILVDQDDGQAEGGGGREDGETADLEVSDHEETNESTDEDSRLLEPQFEAGEEHIISAATLLEDAFAATAFTGATNDGQFVKGRSLFASPEDDNAYVDRRGRITRLDSSELGTVDFSGMTLEESETTDIGGVEMRWGRWSGGFTTDGEALDGGFAFAYTDLDNLSTPEQLTDLGNVTIVYDSPVGPDGVDQSGNAWAVDALSFNANFSDSVLSFDSMDLTQQEGGEISFSLGGGHIQTENMDRASNTFVFDFGTRGQIEGRFLGESARGALVVFEVSDSDGVNQISGVQGVEGTLLFP